MKLLSFVKEERPKDVPFIDSRKPILPPLNMHVYFLQSVLSNVETTKSTSTKEYPSTVQSVDRGKLMIRQVHSAGQLNYIMKPQNY